MIKQTLLTIGLAITGFAATAQTWTKINNVPQPNGNGFHTWVWCTDTNTTHIIGFDRNRHLVTRDGGATWLQVPYDGDKKFKAFDIQFLNKNTGYVAADDSVNKGYIFKTIDGGASWRKITLPGELALVKCVRFIDTSVGFVATENGRYGYTTNGGQTWGVHRINQSPAIERLVITPNEQIAMIGSFTTFWYIYQFGSRTDTTETQVTVPGFVMATGTNVLNSFLDISKTNTERIYGVLTNHKFATSPDGGLTWTNLTANLPSILDSNFRAGSYDYQWQSLSTWFVNDSTGWIVGGNDLMLKTTNRGQSWNVTHTGQPRTAANSRQRNRAVMVFDQGTKRVGWAVGENNNAWKYTETIPNAGGGVGIRNTNSLAGVSIYPNPAYNVLVFNIDANKEYTATLTNSVGQVVRNATINVYTRTMSVENLPAGTYMATIKYGNEVLTKKIVKQ